MNLLELLFVLIGVLCCHAAPASEKPPGHCGPPPRRENNELSGSWEAASYPAGTEAIYACSPGFIRQGTSRYACLKGIWEALGANRECRKRSCGHPGDAEFATFEMEHEEEFVFGAVVKYTCDDGYKFVTRTRIRECTANGRWSNTIPKCELKICPPIEVEDNVNIVYTSTDEEHTAGQVVRFECKDAGQALSGSSEIFCTSQGSWNEDPPRCTDIACQLPVINNGKAKTVKNNFKVKETVDYECNKGYKPMRTPQATCTSVGWSPTPACEEIVCYPGNVGSGRIINPKQMYKEGEKAELDCKSGFLPQGDPDMPRTCTSNGWSPSLLCISQKCPRPDVPNGKIYYSYYYWEHPSFPTNIGGYFHYTCNRGFSPTSRDGNTNYGKSFCMREGWTPIPSCAKQCSMPSSQEIKARIEMSKSEYFEGDTIRFTCYDGYETKDGRTGGEMKCFNAKFPNEGCFKVCQKPDIPNGFINTNQTKFKVGSFVVFTCDEGFRTNKKYLKDTSDCTNRGWDPEPLCEDNFCILETGNGNRRYKSGDVLHFKCGEGHKLKGPDSSQCYYYGWSPKFPSCKDKGNRDQQVFLNVITGSKCPSAPTPPNAAVINVNEDGDEAEIQCKPGHTLDGPARVSCLNGTWESPPMCIQTKKCPGPPRIHNGAIIENTDTNVQYRCNEGYRISNSDMITCVDGRWTTSPTCEENPCGIPERIDNGEVKSAKTTFEPGKHAIYECSPDYTLSENAAICSRGTWTNIPKCIDTSCGDPPLVENGEIISETQEKYLPGNRVVYQCVSGYSMKDNKNDVTCENSGWTEKPTCRRTGQDCNKPPTVNFGDTKEGKQLTYSSGSYITFVCIHLYKLEGSARIQCKDGEWEKAPVCREPCTVKTVDMQKNNIFLKHLPDNTKLYSLHFDNMTFECSQGYGISDRNLLRIQCLDGKLNYPKCLKEGYCTLDRAQMSTNNIRYRNDDLVENGKSISFECAEGMIPKIKDSLETKCINNVIAYPKCITEPCDAPGIPHMKIVPVKDTYNSGDSADIECQESYVIHGPRSIFCSNGQWSELPKCFRGCTISPDSLNENNLELESKDDLSKTFPHDAEVNVKCKEKFRRQNQPTALCSNGNMQYEKCFSGSGCTISPDSLNENNLELVSKDDLSKTFSHDAKVNVKCKEKFRRPNQPTASCSNGNMQYEKCFSGTYCRIKQEQLAENFLVLDDRHDAQVYYGESETVYFKCAHDSTRLETGSCPKQAISPGKLDYPKCPGTNASSR